MMGRLNTVFGISHGLNIALMIMSFGWNPGGIAGIRENPREK
jgi:hypothetical protein